MLEINSAYAECMRMAGPSCGGDTACLQDAEQLLRENRPMHARRLLMGMAGRSAQWNYLFGRALFMLNEHEKAATYLGIAARQQPRTMRNMRALTKKQRSDCMRAENALSAGSSRAAAEYVRLALEMGALHAVVFSLEDIAFDSRTLLKCMFGCADWGRNHTCPSRANNVSLAEYKEMLSRYQWGVIVHAADKSLSQKISLALESRAFHDGYYFAFSLSDCALCGKCAATENAPCRFPRMARPAFHSVGIDVFKTVRGFGLPICTLEHPETEAQNWYSAVFVE